ncbi:reverse transcriptase domain-containing protein [Tanacetum coccineum]
MNGLTVTGDRLTLLEQDQVKNREEIQRLKNQVHSANISTLAAIDRDRIEKTQDQDGKQIWELRHRLTSIEIRLEVASVDRYRLECELYSVRAQIHAIQQELYWRGFEENRLTESIDVLATYGDADPPELQEPSDTQQTTATAKAAEVARAAETTRVAATASGARGSNNAGPATSAGGPNIAGPTVGAVAMNAVPEVKGCSYKEFMNCEPTNFKGTEGAVGLTRWFERSESVFLISKCAENDKVQYVTSTLLDEALSWWNFGVDIKTYNCRFQELAILCPAMVPTTENLLEKLMDQAVRAGTVLVHDNNHNRNHNNNNPNNNNNNNNNNKKRQENARGYANVGAAPARGRDYRGKGTATGANTQPILTCFGCGEHGHFKNQCLQNNGQQHQGEAHRKVYVLGDKNAQQDPNVVTVHQERMLYIYSPHNGEKSEEKRLEDVPIVCDFLEVIREDLPGLPPPRQVKFQIELVPGVAPVARAPYRLSPSKMQELSNQ